MNILLISIGIFSILYQQYIIGGTIIFIIICIKIDYKVYSILNEQTACVYGKNMIRNADLLVIGDMIDVSTLYDGHGTIVSILSPNKSLGASFWVLKKMFSIIDEEKGKIIIVVKKRFSRKQEISLFDYSFISPIHRKMMCLESLAIKRKHPFFFSPVNALILLLRIYHKRSNISQCPIKEIVDFCETRNVRFEYREIA